MTGTVIKCSRPGCGGTIDGGYCDTCGPAPDLAQPAASAGSALSSGAAPSSGAPPSSRDHIELDLGLLAGISDKGLRHPRNEDAMALATAEQASHPVALAVVCDGVSSSRRPDEASLAAVQAAVRVLLAGVREDADLLETSGAAIAAAQQALAGLDEPGPGDPPSATFVSAVLTHETATLCWLGDSRAYWLGAGSAAKRLTDDDSLAGEMVAAGLVSEDDAMALPGAHVVTGWIGADSSGTEPHVTRFTPPGPGVLLLCSDGLWNYRPGAAELAELALPRALTDPLGAAAALTSFALEAGGMDNITVVLAPFPPTASAPEEKSADE